MTKVLITFSMMGLALAASGCNATDDHKLTETQRRHSNLWVVQSYYQQQTQNAIIKQHIVYPYHFETGSAVLNHLGKSDVTVLGEHFREHPGTLNIQRGNSSEQLHQARIATIKSMLQEIGVHSDRIKISDDLAGGDGITSDRAIILLSEKNEVWQPYSD